MCFYRYFRDSVLHYVINCSNYVAEQSSVNIVNISKAKEAMVSIMKETTREMLSYIYDNEHGNNHSHTMASSLMCFYRTNW